MGGKLQWGPEQDVVVGAALGRGAATLGPLLLLSVTRASRPNLWKEVVSGTAAAAGWEENQPKQTFHYVHLSSNI